MKTTTNQCEEILAHLESGRTITPGEALEQYGIARLGARIWDLKREGHQIHHELVKVSTRRGTSRVARYSLIR